MKLMSSTDGMIMIGFPNRKELCMTMGRPQEFYESGNPKLKDQVFTLEEFIDTFTDEKGNVSYYNSWAGFNIPGPKLNEFFDRFELTKREIALRDMVDGAVGDAGDRFYVIAAMEDDLQTMDHEIAHAMFYLNDLYRAKALELVDAMPKSIRKRMEKRMAKWGYAVEVFEDELNAYMATSPKSYMRNRFKLEIKGEMKPFRKLFGSHRSDA